MSRQIGIQQRGSKSFEKTHKKALTKEAARITHPRGTYQNDSERTNGTDSLKRPKHKESLVQAHLGLQARAFG